METTNATLGCIAYAQDIILSPNAAPVSLRGTILNTGPQGRQELLEKNHRTTTRQYHLPGKADRTGDTNLTDQNTEERGRVSSPYPQQQNKQQNV